MKNIFLWAASLGVFLLQACGYHRPTLINNADSPDEVDMRKNGVLALEMLNPDDTEIEFQARNKETGDKYILSRTIDNGSRVHMGRGSLTFYQKSFGELNEVPLVHLYELPPGTYTWRDFLIDGSAIKDTRKVKPKLESREFRIDAGRVTYIGTTLLLGE